MEFVDNLAEMLALASSLLLLLLCSNRALEVASCVDIDKEEDDVEDLPLFWQNAGSSSMDLNTMTQASLHSFQLLNSVRILEDDLGYWVKPRSTTWKLRRGRGVVENAFALLEQSFHELLLKIDLDVMFVLDMVMCCDILHNILLKQSTQDVEMFLNVLREEGYTEDVEVAVPTAAVGVAPGMDEFPHQGSLEKRRELGLHLAQQQNLPQ